MFEQALRTIRALPEDRQAPWLERLDGVRQISHNFGYGVGDDMGHLLAKYGVDD